MTEQNPTAFSINVAHLERQKAFSAETFGPDRSVHAILDHLAKEMEEVRENPDDITEWADMLILVLDGALRRKKFTPQQILDAVLAKQTINEGRNWPDWRTADPDKAILHTKDETELAEQAEQEERIIRGIQSVRDKVKRDLAVIARTEQTVRNIMEVRSTMSELDLVAEVVKEANVSEYLASYVIYNFHSQGELHKDTSKGWFTLSTPEVEETLLNLIPEDGEMEVADLIKEATKRHPGSRVREAYWKLVTEGHLIPNSAGIIRRGTQD